MHSLEGQRVLVTGSSGFIGSHLVEALRAAGCQVVCFVRSQSAPGYVEDSAIKRYVVDYSKPETLIDSPGLRDVNLVFHAAGVTKRTTREQFLQGNVEPTKNLLEAIRVQEIPLSRFVFISSQAVVGPSASAGDFKDEKAQPRPIEYYGESKMLAEQVIQEYGANIPYTIIRPSSVYGPRDIDFLNIFRQISRGFNIYAANRQKLISIIYVRDLVRGILQAAQARTAINRVYHLCDDLPVSWQELQESIVRLIGRRVVTISIPSILLRLAGRCGDLYSQVTGKFSLVNSQKIRLALPAYWLIDNGRAKQDFRFRCDTPLEDGLRETLEWYRANNWM